MNKCILIDVGAVGVRAIQRWGSDFLRTKGGKDGLVLPSGYTYFSMLIGFLKKVGVSKGDVLILCEEGKSWRKNYDIDYKKNRAKQREDQKHIDWKYHFGQINKVNRQLEDSGFNIIRLNFTEADDLIAVGVKTTIFDGYKRIIVSSDSDLLQLLVCPNTYFFSVCMKARGTNGCYKTVKNPLSILEKKIRCGDVGDNIIVHKDTDTPEDAELRKFIIDLINLPDFVVQPIEEQLKKVKPRSIDVSRLPYQNSLARKWNDVYKEDKILEPEYCYALAEKRKTRKCRKKKKKS